MSGSMIHCQDLVKVFDVDGVLHPALQGLNLSIEEGQLLAIVGASGSGKSTLMNILGGLIQPTTGVATVNGHDLSTLNGGTQNRYRQQEVGFVWQQSARNLIPYLTVRENVAYPMLLAGRDGNWVQSRMMALLEMVNLTHRVEHKLPTLSGGEQQRAAIAVALANEPSILLADEPTGELDTATALTIYEAFRTLNKQENLTIIIVSHDPEIAQHVDRVVTIRDGRLVDDAVLNEETAVTPKTIPEKPSLSILKLHQRNGLSPAMPAISVEGLSRVYNPGPQQVMAVKNLNLHVRQGEFVALKGRSGSGKTTLLNCLGALDSPTSGNIQIFGEEIAGLSRRQLARWRRQNIGFIFQAYGLLPMLSAYENVELMLRIATPKEKKRKQHALDLLALVGLAEHAQKRPYELSGGQLQRVAIARALANQPRLILADEATGELDSETGREILTLFQKVAHESGITILLATHDPQVDQFVNRVLNLQDGQIVASLEGVKE